MANTYKLVNPYIRGEFNTKIKSKNSIDAAKKFYSSLSEHFNNSVPKFYFTIQKGGSSNSKFYHFEVKETRKGDEVDFSLKPFDIKNSEEANKKFVENFKSFKGRFNGGGSKRGRSKSRGSKRRSKSRSKSPKRRSKSRSRSNSKRRSSRNDMDIDIEVEDDFYRQAVEYVPVSQPISYLYYDPIIYDLDSVFIPTFYAYLSPFVEVNTRDGYTVTYTSFD